MLINFFFTLKRANVPVSIKELLDLLAALEKSLAFGSVDDFYLLARTCLVKDEKYYDRFDRAFGAYFKNLQNIDDIIEALIPEDWLRKEFEKHFSEEEKAKIESLGGLEKLIEEFKKRLEEQKERHQGGNKWIGTGGTHPLVTVVLTPRVFVLAVREDRAVRSRSGKNVNLPISMTRCRSARAI